MQKLRIRKLFEIPPVLLDCKSYCGLGYKTLDEYEHLEKYVNDSAEKKKFGYRTPDQYTAIKTIKNQLWSWVYEESWVRLPKTSDFSCHQGFEKIFIYNNGYHFSRQWGDGTILSKNGEGEYGATIVWRTFFS